MLVIILAALVVSYASSLRAWVDQQQQLSALRTEQTERTQRVAQLQDDIDRWNDPAYVKAQARQRFGYVMPGEVGYVVLDDKPPAKVVRPAAAAPAVAPWWEQLWASTDAADGKVPGSTRAPDAPPATPTPTPTPEKTLRATPDGS